MATFASISEYSLADDEAEDSFSILPLFTNPASPRYAREAVVHHSINGSFAIRRGRWKLELCPGSGGWSDPKPGGQDAYLPAVQLYDVESDVAETRNVQANYPQVVKELTELLKRLSAERPKHNGQTPGQRWFVFRKPHEVADQLMLIKWKNCPC